ncbi:MAG TPA: DinB family protein [Candidatus Limnocylindrales bacterium]|nr:DinB family protein [Candidatus Limnocylindrales bacterium]
MSEVDRILDQMDRAWEGDAWHGPSVKRVLDNITAELAVQHPVHSAHSIWEIVNHVASWNRIVRHRLIGDPIEPTPEVDWPPVWDKSEVAWKRTLENLDESRKLLRKTVDGMKEEQLNVQLPGEGYTNYVMLHGLVQHDLYHAGQIALLKKAVR